MDSEPLPPLDLSLQQTSSQRDKRGLLCLLLPAVCLRNICIYSLPANECTTAGLNAEVEVHCQHADLRGPRNSVKKELRPTHLLIQISLAL